MRIAADWRTFRALETGTATAHQEFLAAGSRVSLVPMPARRRSAAATTRVFIRASLLNLLRHLYYTRMPHGGRLFSGQGSPTRRTAARNRGSPRIASHARSALRNTSPGARSANAASK